MNKDIYTAVNIHDKFDLWDDVVRSPVMRFKQNSTNCTKLAQNFVRWAWVEAGNAVNLRFSI